MTDAEIAALDVLSRKQLDVFERELEFTSGGFTTSTVVQGDSFRCTFSAEGPSGVVTIESTIAPLGDGPVNVVAANAKSDSYRQDLAARMAAAVAGSGKRGRSK